MEKKKININLIKPNPSNPRTIRDEKFKKLVKSLEDFPEMLELRPIVVDENLTVLGGNMRLKAAKAAGLREVWIGEVHLDEKKKKEFIIKDNVNYGNWDYLLLEDTEVLQEWGMELPSWVVDNMEEEDDFFTEDFYEPQRVEEQFFETPPPPSGATYLLLMLENEDWEFVKRVEPALQKQTGTDNISDAIYKIIME